MTRDRTPEQQFDAALDAAEDAILTASPAEILTATVSGDVRSIVEVVLRARGYQTDGTRRPAARRPRTNTRMPAAFVPRPGDAYGAEGMRATFDSRGARSDNDDDDSSL